MCPVHFARINHTNQPSEPSTMDFKTIAVTGATGFIGSHLTLQLLDRGYTVHATVRKNVADRLSHLTAHPSASDKLRIFEADLLKPHSFDDAISGCDAVMHVASPFMLKAADPYNDVIKPAVDGTLNVLHSCASSKSVKKIVLTSSIAAVSSKAAASNGQVDTEENWNDIATETYLHYMYSKTAAERAAWDFIASNKKKTGVNDIDLVVINPAMVMGPILNKHIYAESFDVLRECVTGKMFGIVDLSISVVDVRDVATAHVKALESCTAKGRYICSASCDDDQVDVRDFVKAAKLKGFGPPERDLSGPWTTSIIKLFSYFMPRQEGETLRYALGTKYRVSNRKIIEELGMTFRPVEETLAESLETLVKWGHLENPNS